MIVRGLLFYQHDRQRSWLVATNNQPLFILDDPSTRKKRRLVQRVTDLAVAISMRNTSVLDLADCHSSSFHDLSVLAAMLTSRPKDGSWQKNWDVLTHAIHADRSAILISGASNGRAEFALDEHRTRNRPKLSDAVAMLSSKNITLSVLSA